MLLVTLALEEEIIFALQEIRSAAEKGSDSMPFPAMVRDVGLENSIVLFAPGRIWKIDLRTRSVRGEVSRGALASQTED